MSLQIDETATPQEWVCELERDGETHEVVFAYRYPDPDDRYQHASTVPTGEGETTSPQDAYEASLELCLACIVGIDGIDGPDGEPVDWQDDDQIGEQFACETGREARIFLLQHLGGTYAESDGVIFRLSQHLLKSDKLDEVDGKKPEANSSAA